MTRKLTFALIFVFWLCMNGLLWQAEYGGGKEAGSSVPVRLVWEKILKAPDSSSLEINHRERKLGYVRWMPNIGEEQASGKAGAEEAAPEGMIKNTTGYSVDVDGNTMLASVTNHLRGNIHLEFGKDYQWSSFHLQAQLKLGVIEIQSKAGDQAVQFKFSSPGYSMEQRFTYSELQNPAKLLEAFDLPATLLTVLPLAGQSQTGLEWSPNLSWQAFNDTIRYGRNTVGIYRLKAKLWGRYEATVLVSRVGEILRIDLPDKLVFKNDILFVN